MTAGYPQLEIAAIPPLNDSLDYLYTNRFTPSSEPWDTIWVVPHNARADIPYWPSYRGTSDEDFVYRCSSDAVVKASFRCSGTGETLNGYHSPLYLDMVVRSLAWEQAPMGDIFLYSYRIVPTQWNLKGVIVSLYFGGGIGNSTDDWYWRAFNDRSTYYKNQHMAIVEDQESWSKGCVGYRIFPPRTVPPQTLKWTTKDDFSRSEALRCIRSERQYTSVMYSLLSSGVQFSQGEVFGSGWISVGPFDVAVGDTLVIWTAEILGMGRTDVLRKSTILDKLYEKDFVTPVPPPPPPLRVEAGKKTVTLKWDALAGQADPETYQDSAHLDSVNVPFEGYRVYKSTESINGPWSLLAEYDIAGNGFGMEFGLRRDFTETALLDYFEYYYAVTAFSKQDTVTGLPSRESRKELTAVSAVPRDPPQARVGNVAVVPNPYRGDIAYYQYNPPWERPTGKWTTWFENDRRVQFINLPARCVIRIYTLSGDIVETLYHDDPTKSYHDWNLTSHVGQATASGIYLFSVQDSNSGEVQAGKFVIIK